MKNLIFSIFIIHLLVYVNLQSQPYGWFVQQSGTTNNLDGVYFADYNTGIVVGQSGTVRRTTNGGNNWVGITTGVSAHLFNVFFINSSTGWIVGDIGTILKTTNGGLNWVTQTSGTGIQLRSISFINANTGFVVGWYGVFLRTTNGGTNWSSFSTGISTNLCCVYFLDANTGFASGQFGKLLRSTNSGTNWSEISSGTSWQLESVHFLNATTGVVVGEAGTIRRTTNGGVNWTTQSSGTSNWLYGMSTKQANFHTIVGDYGVIRKTSNGGLNWYAQTSNTSNLLSSINYVDTNVGWAVGINGTIIKTTTGGWLLPGAASLNTPANNATCVSLTPYLDWSDVFPPVSNYRVQIATDNAFNNLVHNVAGINVSEYTVPGGVLSYNTLYYWRVRATNQVGESPNWSSVRNFRTTTMTPSVPNLTAPPNNSVTNLTPQLRWDSIAVASAYRCQVALDTGFSNLVLDSTISLYCSINIRSGLLQQNTRYYWRVNAQNSCITSAYSQRWSFLTQNPTGINIVSSEIPKVYALYNNYPNPFNPVTSIAFDLPEKSNVKITIYNAVGQIVSLLLNNRLEAGKYSINWNAENFASGLYFYRIEAVSGTDKIFVNTKKMVLIK